jgi:N-acetylglucosamine-6-sulfatase
VSAQARGRATAVCLAAVVIAGVSSATPGEARTSAGAGRPAVSASARADVATLGPRPNIVLVTSDDQTLYDMRWMPKTRHLLGDFGATFTHAVSPNPNCCPSRAEILTGQFSQNNGVRTNAGRFGGVRALNDYHDTVGPWLQAAGYYTGFTGKFLNNFFARMSPPPGWDQFDAMVEGMGLYRYYDFAVSHNGRLRWHRNIHESRFLARDGARIIRAAVAAGKPFFLWESQLAPHDALIHHRWVPPVPAAGDAQLFKHVRPPSFNDPAFMEADIRDKPGFIPRSHLPTRHELRTLFVRRIQSLQSLDDAVAQLIKVLRATGQLKNTVIAFTSDNGYVLGEHSYRGKVLAYEQALRVPLLVRGPAIPAGVTRAATVATVDLAPTFVALADASPSVTMDGRSLLGILRQGTGRGYSTLLVQAGPRTGTPLAHTGTDPSGWFYRGVRTARYTFVDYPRYRAELYDRVRDPHELVNVARSAAYGAIRKQLARRTMVLSSCAGASCRRTYPPLPRPG